jgi:hypothetical protein
MKRVVLSLSLALAAFSGSDIAALRKALSSLPPGMRVETTYDSTEIVALAPGIASLTTYYRTEFVGSAAPVRFGGAISMIWTHEPGGWRIRGGHSSSAVGDVP